jgi:hypothetical protein
MFKSDDSGAIHLVPDGAVVTPLGASEAFHKAEAEYAHGWYASLTGEIWG